MIGADKDLAAHFTVIRARGRCLCGLPIDEVFGEVPEGGDCTLISFNLLTCTAEMIKNQAESLGISIGAYITRLVGNDNQFQD